MSTALDRAIASGIALGDAIGSPAEDYLKQQKKEDFEKAQQDLRFQQAIQELALRDPDLAASLTQIQPGQTVDDQKSVKPLALTPDQQNAFNKGSAVPEVKTQEIGGFAYDPAAYRSLKLKAFADQQDIANQKYAALDDAKLKTGFFEPNSGKFIQKVGDQLVYRDIPKYVEPQATQGAQGVFGQPVDTSLGSTSLQYPQDSKAQATSAIGDQEPTSLSGILDKKLANQKAIQDAITQRQIDAQNRAFVHSDEQLNRRFDQQNEVLKGKGEKDSIDPDALHGDIQDVLEGRNSVAAIKQTMGRSNISAKYMAQVRKGIREADPNFDFAASDAGAKSLSTPFYQKSITAINAIEPNLDAIKQLSSQVDRIGVKGVDNLIQKAGIQFGNKKISNFHEARQLLADEVGVALGQGGVSDMKLQLGLDLLDPSVSDDVFASNVDTIGHFLENRKKALQGLRYKSSTVGDKQIPSASTTEPQGGGSSSLSLDDFKKKHGLK
jgi:hypothetical protein